MRVLHLESLERRDLLHNHSIATPHDTIPLFGHDGVAVTTGALKASGGDIRIPAGATVTVKDLTATARNVLVEGTLLFDPNVHTRLTVETIVVAPTGRLELKPSAGVTAEIVIADAPLDVSADPDQFGHGILVLGAVDVDGADKSEFVRLAAEPKSGDMTLVLSSPATGWKVGDQLVIPDSRQLTTADGLTILDPQTGKYLRSVNGSPQDERVTVAGVSRDGLTVKLSGALAYDHGGARDADGVLRFLPHVANMTRNVVIRSENPAGVRGHFFATDDAQVEIENAAFVEMGRTTSAVLDATTNHIGRYAIHLHHLDNTAPFLTHGERFLVSGSVIDGSPKWGIAIHDAHYGRVANNVVFNAVGAGIVQEDGSETGNEFLYNFVLRNSGSLFDIDDGPVNRRPGQAAVSADEVGHEGAGFWLRSWNESVFVGNVAVGAQLTGFVVFASGDADHVPLAPGAVGVRTAKLRLLTPSEFDGNEVYGGTPRPFNPWFQSAPITLSNSTIWHAASEIGFLSQYVTEQSHTTIDGMTILFDSNRVETEDAVGILSTTSTIATNVEIAGANIGISHQSASKKAYNYSRYEHLVLANDIDFVMAGSLSRSTDSQRTDILDATLNGTVGLKMELNPLKPQPRRKSILALDEVYVQFSGDTSVYRAWYDAQRTDYVVPEAKYSTTGKLVVDGAPRPTMTNEELFSEVGEAIGGKVMSDNAFQISGHHGWFELAE